MENQQGDQLPITQSDGDRIDHYLLEFAYDDESSLSMFSSWINIEGLGNDFISENPMEPVSTPTDASTFNANGSMETGNQDGGIMSLSNGEPSLGSSNGSPPMITHQDNVFSFPDVAFSISNDSLSAEDHQSNYPILSDSPLLGFDGSSPSANQIDQVPDFSITPFVLDDSLLLENQQAKGPSSVNTWSDLNGSNPMADQKSQALSFSEASSVGLHNLLSFGISQDSVPSSVNTYCFDSNGSKPTENQISQTLSFTNTSSFGSNVGSQKIDVPRSVNTSCFVSNGSNPMESQVSEALTFANSASFGSNMGSQKIDVPSSVNTFCFGSNGSNPMESQVSQALSFANPSSFGSNVGRLKMDVPSSVSTSYFDSNGSNPMESQVPQALSFANFSSFGSNVGSQKMDVPSSVNTSCLVSNGSNSMESQVSQALSFTNFSSFGLNGSLLGRNKETQLPNFTKTSSIGSIDSLFLGNKQVHVPSLSNTSWIDSGRSAVPITSPHSHLSIFCETSQSRFNGSLSNRNQPNLGPTSTPYSSLLSLVKNSMHMGNKEAIVSSLSNNTNLLGSIGSDSTRNQANLGSSSTYTLLGLNNSTLARNQQPDVSSLGKTALLSSIGSLSTRNQEAYVPRIGNKTSFGLKDYWAVGNIPSTCNGLPWSSSNGSVFMSKSFDFDSNSLYTSLFGSNNGSPTSKNQLGVVPSQKIPEKYNPNRSSRIQNKPPVDVREKKPWMVYGNPHKCRLCGKAFPTSYSLGGHMSYHTKTMKKEALLSGMDKNLVYYHLFNMFKPPIDTVVSHWFDVYSTASATGKKRKHSNEEKEGSSEHVEAGTKEAFGGNASIVE